MKKKFKTIRDIAAYYDEISAKKYDTVFTKEKVEVVHTIPDIPDILELNKDMEPYLIKIGRAHV